MGHTLPQKNCLISATDNDLTLFSKILPTHCPLLSQISDNIILAMNTIQDVNHHAKIFLMLSLDVHKAFETVPNELKLGMYAYDILPFIPQPVW